jgi:5-(carboxyamino)imidazole ribonucleotide synthase
MMALAGYPLGIECHLLDTRADSSGGQVAPIRVAELDDLQALEALAREADVITFDIENVSVAALESLQAIVPVHPAPAAVAVAQDRLSEKRLFDSLGIPAAPYVTIDGAADFDEVDTELGWPVVIKARRLGYDGRGQRLVDSAGELAAAWAELGERPAIAEGFVDFDCEVSLIGVSDQSQNLRFYPLTENRHADGMLESSIAPFVNAELQQQAEAWMTAMVRKFHYVGILTIEFFVTPSGLVANEIAPRVHNSGHWTIEGAVSSQFENHLRAILGLPTGATTTRGTIAMRNLIGRMPARAELLAIDGLHMHDYGKSPRPGRKIGHCTMVAADRNSAQASLDTLDRLLGSSTA